MANGPFMVPGRPTAPRATRVPPRSRTGRIAGGLASDVTNRAGRTRAASAQPGLALARINRFDRLPVRATRSE